MSTSRRRASSILDALSAAGALSGVPALVRAHRAVTDPDARNFLQHSLSFLLEDHRGLIAVGPHKLAPSDDDPPPVGEPIPVLDFDGYRALVEMRASELQTEGLRSCMVAEGEAFHVPRAAGRLLECIEVEQPAYRIERGRLLLEAATGLDCSAFYDANVHLEPGSAAARIGAFLDSEEATMFRPGTRYFFGHRIPS